MPASNIAQQLDQLQAITSSPKMASNPVAGFVATPDQVSFKIPDTRGVKSVDLLSSPYADPGSAKVAQSWNAPDAGGSFSHVPPATSASGKLHFWIRLNPQGTSGSAKIVGRQSVSL